MKKKSNHENNLILIENKLEYDMVLSNWKDITSDIDALNILLRRAKFKVRGYMSFSMDPIVLFVQWKIFSFKKILVDFKIKLIGKVYWRFNCLKNNTEVNTTTLQT